MRPLAILFLLLGAADLVAIDALLGPAALADGPGAEVGGPGSGAAERTQPPASAPPIAVAVAADHPERPIPPPPPAAAPAPEEPARQVPEPAPEPADHPDSLPAPVLLHFDLDSDQLGATSRAALDRVARLLEDRAELTAQIAGHADESGSQEHNQDLSERRARAVADHLQERGVEAARLAVRAFGELQPLDGGRERARRNRRVEIRFASPTSTGDVP